MIRDRKESRLHKCFDFIHTHIIAIIIAVVVIAGAASTAVIVDQDMLTIHETKTDDTTYVPADTVYFAMDEVRTLDPLASSDRDVYHITQLLYSSLFRLDASLALEKDLVAAYTPHAADGSVDIRLKKGIQFSDGSSLTAWDVQFTVYQIQRIGAGSPYYADASVIDAVEVRDTRNLTIRFASPSDAALDHLTFPIVSGDGYTSGSNANVGSGPYRYRSFDRMHGLRLRPNKYYYGEKAVNDLEFQIVDDKETTTGLMTMDAVTAYINTSPDADVDAEDKHLRATAIPSGEMEFLGFNFRNAQLAKPEVRRAIALAIDVQSIIDDNYGSAGAVSDTVYFPGFLGTENQGDAYAQDQSGAAKLLAQVGFADKNEDGWLENEAGKRLPFSILVNAGDSRRVDTAVAISEALQTIGIRTHVVRRSWDAYRSAVRSGDFDLYLGGYQFDKKFDLRALLDSGNAVGYRNEEVSAAVRRMETCIGPKRLRETYTGLKQILIDELPYYCLCYKTYTFVTVDHFTAAEQPTFFDHYRGCGQWKWEKKAVPPQTDAETEKTDGDAAADAN